MAEFQAGQVLWDLDDVYGRTASKTGKSETIELIWANVKQKVAAHNVGSRDVKQLAEEAFNNITPETWKNCCNHVETLEKEYYERGRRLYHDIDELVICLGDDSSSGDSSCRVDSAADESGNESFLGVEYLEFDDD
ncbi:uncharacterized protein LOC125489585 [Plutella xylostella]|uniref:uncharacterized protein LOC125489585 n=1 Tax=Plutella xylostella TaxID=51655 RepID=UPI00203266B2|nr:uncharacterized protein LOC125489585 [Plutella xylostella]